ncbi:class I SAM-dependent DNA methyltransferase [Rhizobium sp. TRM95796]|uniref:class I SAM-dependent DNA methyltransferase n=1 Tax=Rhizobium sp. TRM95796 TaxID=2979862 RepID=UPI0021E81DFB|nr:methyltransferase [Rhizobium sp. TRM95796]MCV3765881.1 methyltransferase domain-containing protein [Rhizobium sp. TRM95796]
MAPKRILTSGDLVADRRADYAAMLIESGDALAAADLMEQALELAPGWSAGWFRLGEYREKAGLVEPAVEAYRRVAASDDAALFGVDLKLAALGAAETPALPPSAYVEGLFDDYADRFETALVEKLGYSVPKKLAALIRTAKGDAHFALAVDLGCGTGLLGPEIGDCVSALEGYDLSENMLAKARAKGVYRHLARADLSLSPEASGLFDGLEQGRADLVAAADVMMYLGDLDAAFANAAALAAAGGLFAFSVEKDEAQTGFSLRPSLRYAHSRAHVETMLARHGLSPVACEETVIRMDAGQPITGLLFLARK